MNGTNTWRQFGVTRDGLGLVTIEELAGAKRRPGRHYFAEPGDVPVVPVADPPVVDDPIADPAVAGDDWKTHVPDDWGVFEKRNIPGDDLDKVVHKSKQYDELTQDGAGEAVAYAKSLGLSGYALRDYLQRVAESVPADDPNADPAPIADPAVAGDPAPAVPPAGDPAEVPLTRAELAAWQAEQDAKTDDRVNQRIAASQAEQRTAQDLATAQADESRGLESALDGMGIPIDTRDVALPGREPQPVDMNRRGARALMLDTCQQIHEASVHRDDPQRQAKLNAPFSQQTITQASAAIAPYIVDRYGQVDPSGAAGQLDSNGKPVVPPAGIAGGRGSRPQKDVKDMTKGEKEVEMKRRVAVKLGK